MKDEEHHKDGSPSLSGPSQRECQAAPDEAPCREVEDALKEQLHFLQTLIDTIPNPIFYKDTQGYYLGCNKAFQERLGLERSQIVGRTLYHLFPPDLADEYHKMDNALLQNPGEQVHETSIRYADGQIRDVIINKATFTNTDGSLAGLVGVTLDITERKQAERALKAAHDELEKRVERRTAELAKANEELRNEIAERERAEEALRVSVEKLKLFAYSVIHDLKSPAIGVYGFANLLNKHYGEVLDERARGWCHQIFKASEHLRDLVEAINAYVAAKEAPLSLEQVDMGEVIASVGEEFSLRFKARKLRWIVAEDLPSIRADRLSMVRTFTNLVDNALKYGGENLSEIRIAYRETDDFHVFSVSDDGVGISMEDSDRLFRFFHRDRTSRGVEGAGLGLAIVKETAERHGGKVEVEAGIDKGTVFRVFIAKSL